MRPLLNGGTLGRPHGHRSRNGQSLLRRGSHCWPGIAYVGRAKIGRATYPRLKRMSGASPPVTPTLGGRRQSIEQWVHALGWVLTLLALGLNVLSGTATYQALSGEQVRHDALALLTVIASPFATLLAIVCALSTRLAPNPLTLRRALLWIILAVLAIAGWPASCFVSVVNAPNLGKTYSCNEAKEGCWCSTDSNAHGESACRKHYACCVEYPERMDFAPDDPHPYDPGGCDCFDLAPGETCQNVAQSRYDLRGVKSTPDRCPPP
jgi:hypothetical protein